jgi:hypothetical protein
MEGAEMKMVSNLLLLTALLVSIVGCSKGGPQHPPTTRTSRVEPIDPLERDEQAIEFTAEQAKKNIDAIKADAEDALRRTRQGVKSTVKQHSADLSELAAEAAENAKDRAEDLTDAVDQSVQDRASDLRARIRKRLEAEQKAINEEEAESTR